VDSDGRNRLVAVGLLLIGAGFIFLIAADRPGLEISRPVRKRQAATG
jgi:hypothetical protein